jgi:membrane-associated phospholipid phosphatase
MTGYAATEGRRLPRGWAHLLLQLVIWLGFYAAYQVVRGHADRDILKAFTNGEWVITTERRLGALFEPSLQRLVDSSQFLIQLTSYTYWLSQFVVVGVTLLWVYLRHHERFYRFRNTLILANVMGLIGYLVVPTAPPRFFPFEGFADTFSAYSGVNHSSGLIASVANQYAAMPSLHAMDAIIVGLTMMALVRSRVAKVIWLLWAPWVWFTVMSTGNHYWLDVVAGVALAGIAYLIVRRGRLAPRHA